jgi:hypothetical protein
VFLPEKLIEITALQQYEMMEGVKNNEELMEGVV